MEWCVVKKRALQCDEIERALHVRPCGEVAVGTGEIPNAKLKRAMLGANIEHADTALRALARVDIDEQFRQAIEAAVAAEDKEALRNVIYAQFPPDSKRKRLKLKPPVGPEELLRLLNDRVVEIAADLLRDRALRTHVRKFVTERLDTLILTTLGMKRSSWGGVEWASHSESNIQKHMKAIIEAEVDAQMEQIVASLRLESLCERLNQSAVEQIETAYERAYRDAIGKKLREWAQKRAQLDVERLFEEVRAQNPGLPEDDDDGD
jgi:hypothetical protein